MVSDLLAWYLEPFRQYAEFGGRARRWEFWSFTLGNWFLFLVLEIVAAMGWPVLSRGAGLLALLYSLGVFIPSIAVTVRRLHDTGRTGWWMLLGFVPIVGLVLLVFLVQDSEPGRNRWGQNPKGDVDPTELLESRVLGAQADETGGPST